MAVMARQESSSSSFTYEWTYDVFLSFRGKDTRFSFTGNLYNALNQRGIHTFIDDKQLERGETITPALLAAIENSRIAIVVLSQNYASSTFCLDELVKILECIKRQGRLVWPIFYGVDPSEVRHQRGRYGESMSKHAERLQDNKEKVQKWRWALLQVANLSGWHFHGDEYEYEFVGRIIEEVSGKINRKPLHIAKFPVGLTSRVSKVNSLLNLEQDDIVLMIGICGIGGIGKSTIARALYNLIGDSFEGLCFLDDVRENSTKHGLVHLQERLLFDITGEKDIKLGNVYRGIPIIKQRLQGKKVLLILDNVDKREQLEATVGGLDWFGSGSRIIITTRDTHLLNSHGVKRIYEVEVLSHEEALELLNWNAFKKIEVDPTYKDIVNRVVCYASGLPLALEVIGSNLSGKTIKEWNSALDKYERIPIKEVQVVLKVSYNALEDDQQKIFLDIACHFKGCVLTYVKDMLDAHFGVCQEYGIGVLIEKSLIKINCGVVTMHDLVQEMGKEIVYQESVKNPGERSRLWWSEDIIQVLEENTGTDRIEVIILDLPEDEQEVRWNGEAFKMMYNLKILKIRNVRFSKGPKHLPNSLRVLEWLDYPSRYLPTDFCPKKLVMLKMKRGCLVSFKPSTRMEALSVLNFDECEFLRKIPNVSNIPNITELSLERCWNLIEIHDTVGFLKKLTYLDASGCRKLRSFPQAFNLPSLEYLYLLGCTRLRHFPKILEKMEKLTRLDLSDTAIEELPFSICYLTCLENLAFKHHRKIQLPRSIRKLSTLKSITVEACTSLLFSEEDNSNQENVICTMLSGAESVDLSYTHISDESLVSCLTWFANVQYLLLNSTNVRILPACIKDCHFLIGINLDNCKQFRGCRELPANLRQISAPNCELLSSQSRRLFLNQVLLTGDAEVKEFYACVPGTRLFPEWVDYSSRGASSISFWFRNKFPELAFSFVIGHVEYGRWGFDGDIVVDIIINGKKFKISPRSYIYPDVIVTDHIVVFNIPGIIDVLKEFYFGNGEWNHVKISFMFDVPLETDASFEARVKESGIHILKQKSSMKDIRVTNPYKLDVNKHPWLKKSHGFVDEAASDSEIPYLEQQQRLGSLTPHVEPGRDLRWLLPPATTIFVRSQFLGYNDLLRWHRGKRPLHRGEARTPPPRSSASATCAQDSLFQKKPAYDDLHICYTKMYPPLEEEEDSIDEKEEDKTASYIIKRYICPLCEQRNRYAGHSKHWRIYGVGNLSYYWKECKEINYRGSFDEMFRNLIKQTGWKMNVNNGLVAKSLAGWKALELHKMQATFFLIRLPLPIYRWDDEEWDLTSFSPCLSGSTNGKGNDTINKAKGREIIASSSSSNKEAKGKSQLAGQIITDNCNNEEENDESQLAELPSSSKGADRIEAITLDLAEGKEEVNWNGKAFERMKNLSMLVIRNVCFFEGPKNLPNSLRMLEWWEYPAPCLPTDFHPKKLAMLKMPRSCLVSFKPSKRMETLSVLNFDK